MVNAGLLKLLILLPGYQLFGQEQALIGLARLLRDKEIDSEFILHGKWGELIAAQIKLDGFRFAKLPMGTIWSVSLFISQPLALLRNLWALVQCSFTLFKMLRHGRFSHVIVGNSTFAVYLLPALFLSCVCVIYRHGDELTTHSWFHRLINYLIFRRVDFHVVNCRFIARRILDRFPNTKPVVIYNTPWRVGAPQTDGVGSGKFYSSPGVIRLLYVGQLAEHKGVLLLLDAFRVLADEYPRLVLDIVGDIPGVGTCKPSNMLGPLNSIIADLPGRVFHYGYQSDVAAYYTRAHLHVCPSIWQEPSPNVILDAKQYGLPTVAFDVGGISELVVHGENGFICRNASVADLVVGIKHFLDDVDRLKQSGLAARQSIDETFGNQHFVEQWLSVLNAATGEALNA